MSDRIEIVKELRALEQHYTFKAVRSPEDHERFLKDFLADIQEFPLTAIKAACAEWRRSEAKRMPTSGQLMPLIRKHLPIPKVSRLEPWRELTDEEFAALSLNGKIRHHEILAMECGRKAGPMWRNGGPVALADMPPSYHEWKRRQQNHLDEAQRLRSHMRLMERSA